MIVDRSQASRRPVRGRWALGAALAAVVLAIGLGAIAYYRSEADRIGRARYEEIRAIAALKAAEIERWRGHRLFDAESVAASPFVRKAVSAILREPRDAGLASELRERLGIEVQAGTYEDALLLRPDGTVLFSARADPDAVSGPVLAALDEATQRKAPALSEIYRCRHGVVHLDAIAPIADAEGRLLAAVDLRGDAATFLFPLVQRWPAPSPSAETLLVRRVGGEVIFLNDLRHRQGAALALRYPLTRTDVPAVQAALGKRGRFQGSDYRGVEVLADLSRIPGSDWLMVAKVDEAEVMAEARYRAGVAIVVLVLGALLAAAAAITLYRSRQNRILRELHSAERARREAVEEMRIAFYSIGDAVITTDREGRIRHMNAVATALTGWSEDEARGTPIGEVFRVVNEETRADVESPVDRVLREGKVVGLANHSLLVARDGGERPIADSGAPIRDEDGAISGVVLVFRDQAEERAAQRAIAESARRMAAILGAVPDIVMEVDANKIYTWANGPGFEFFGDDVIGREAAEYFEGEQDTYVQVQPLFEGGEQTIYLESWQRRRDGERRLLAWWCRVLKDGHGNVTGALSTARDVTERRNADAALRASEEKFAKVFHTSPYAITITRPADGKFLDVNEAFTAITGYTREEALADSSLGMGLWADAEDRKGVVSALREGKVVAGREFTFRTRTGALIECQFSAQLVRLGEETCILSSINDITDRRRTEKALRESEEKYRILVENAEEVIFVAQGGTLRFVNARTRSVLGCSAAELISRPFAEFIHPDDRALVGDRHVRRLRGEDLPSRYSFRIVNRAGETIWVELNAVVIDWEGSPATLNFLTDITERTRAEGRRLELEEQLRAAQKMEAIGSLAGGIAHDFNNLLAVILSYAGFLLDGAEEGSPMREDLHEIVKAGERAANLTRQLLAFGRRQILQPAVLDPNRVVAEFDTMLRRLLGEDIDFVQALGPAVGRVRADPSQLGQVLMNLVINARDAMPQGGKLTIETAAVELDEDYASSHVGMAPGAYVLLAVTDTGVGMDADTRARIFEPFFTTKKGKGTGLGLSTAYGIVKQSGGDIWVYSEPGVGTTFKVYLPRLAEQPTETPKSAAPVGATSGTETVVVVEDEEAVRNLTARILRTAGYAVLVAPNGPEALSVCAAHAGEIHLLLTDVVLPEMSGKALADRLSPLRPTLKVLYMSGYTDNAIVHHGVLEAGTSFIAKPFSAADLLRTVREALDERG